MWWRWPKKVDLYFTSREFAGFLGAQRVGRTQTGTARQRVDEALNELTRFAPTELAIWFSSAMLEAGVLPAIAGGATRSDLEALARKALAEYGQTALYEIAIGSADPAGRRVWAALPKEWLEALRAAAHERSWRIVSVAPSFAALTATDDKISSALGQLTLMVEKDGITVLPGNATASEVLIYPANDGSVELALERASLAAPDPDSVRLVEMPAGAPTDRVANLEWKPSALWMVPKWGRA